MTTRKSALDPNVSAEAREASADRVIAGKSAHALLALIASGFAWPYALTAQDIAAADVRRTARKLAARETAAA